MKTKWAVLGGFAAIAIAVAVGCDTSGGSSFGDDAGSITKPVVVQIRFGLPACSSSSAGYLDGAAFNGGAGYVYLSPACTSPNSSMFVGIKVISSVIPSEVDYYEWTIRSWTGASPDGIFTADTYDALIDTNGVFKVRTSADQIRYKSTAASNLMALASVYNQMIDVTVMTKDGHMASGAISLYLNSGQVTGGQLVYGGLQATDARSNFRVGHPADYYKFTNTGATNLLRMAGEGFATTLVLYTTNLTAVATNEGVFSGSFISQINSVLASNTVYIVEATSAKLQGAGSYSIFNSTGPLAPTANPFVSSGSCNTIAGTYALNEIMVVNLTFDGQSHVFTNLNSGSVTLTQTGCNFAYPLVDPTGLIPPTLLQGRIITSPQNLELYNQSVIPQSSEIILSSSSIGGTGLTFGGNLTIQSAGSISGRFLDTPYSVSFTSEAVFSK